MRTWAVVAGLVAGWAAVAQGGQLKLENVAADARWVAHVDADAARSSPVIQRFWEGCVEGNRRMKAKLDKLEKEWGLNVPKDLHGMTLYGSRFAPHHGVIVVSADWNREVFVQRIAKEPDHKTVKFEDHEIHVWTAHKGRKFAHEAAAAFAAPDQLVLAGNAGQLKSALKVLAGKAPGLAGKESPLAEKARAGAIFLARAVGVEGAKLPGKHPLPKLVKQFDYAEGQSGSEWFGHLSVTAVSGDVAGQLKNVLQGFLAMVSLHMHDRPEMVKLLQSVDFKIDGATLTATFKAPVDKLAAEMPALAKMIKEHMKRHAARFEKSKHDHKDKEKDKDKHKHEHPKKKDAAKEHCPSKDKK